VQTLPEIAIAIAFLAFNLINGKAVRGSMQQLTSFKDAKAYIIEIDGKRFLKCPLESCGWNVGYTPGELNPLDCEILRVCNFGARSYAIGVSMPEDCPHKLDVSYLVGLELKNLRRVIRGP